MSKIISFWGLALILVGCRTFDFQELNSFGSLNSFLPAMEIIFDDQSFENEKQHIVSNSQRIVSDDDVLSFSTPSNTYTSIVYDKEATLFIRNYFYSNVCNRMGEAKGKIRITRYYYDTGSPFSVLLYFSLFTGGTINLLGIPAYIARVSVGLNVDVLDNEGKLVAHYTAYAKDKAPVAAYYGYTFHDATQKVKYTAYEQALDEIKANMQKDKNTLIKVLK